MNKKTSLRNAVGIAVVAGLAIGLLPASNAQAQACDPAAAPAGGTLDPLSIPKYVTPLVIPPVMNNDRAAERLRHRGAPVPAADPAGRASGTRSTAATGLAFPPTTVWSYGPAADPLPDSTASRAVAPGLRPRPTRSSTTRPTPSRTPLNAPTTVAGSTTWRIDDGRTSCRTCCRSTRPCTGPTRARTALTAACQDGLPRATTPTLLHRTGADRHPRPRRPRRSGERRLPRGLVAAGRRQ